MRIKTKEEVMNNIKLIESKNEDTLIGMNVSELIDQLGWNIVTAVSFDRVSYLTAEVKRVEIPFEVYFANNFKVADKVFDIAIDNMLLNNDIYLAVYEKDSEVIAELKIKIDTRKYSEPIYLRIKENTFEDIYDAMEVVIENNVGGVLSIDNKFYSIVPNIAEGKLDIIDTDTAEMITDCYVADSEMVLWCLAHKLYELNKISEDFFNFLIGFDEDDDDDNDSLFDYLYSYPSDILETFADKEDYELFIYSL